MKLFDYCSFLMLFVLFGCEKAEVPTEAVEVVAEAEAEEPVVAEAPYAGYFSVPGIESDILFDFSEIYNDDNDPKLELWLSIRTVDLFPHSTMQIGISQFYEEQTLIVRIDSIIEPSGFLTAPGTGFGTVLINNENIQEFVFINGKKVDRYLINLEPEAVTTKPIETSFSEAVYGTTVRHLENSFFFRSRIDLADVNIYEGFLEQIAETGLFTEYYAYDISSQDIYYPPFLVNESDDHYFYHYYTYENFADFVSLSGLLSVYAQQHIEEDSGVRLDLYGWDGTHFTSW